jgi:hypothetical protein
MPIDLTHPKEIDAALDKWFETHFGNFTPGTEIHALLDASKRSLRELLGLTQTPAHSPPQTETQE